MARPAMVLRRIAVGVVLLAVPVGGIFFLAKGCMSYLASEGATVQAYFRAIGAGKPAQACALLAEPARIKLMAERKADTCERAVGALSDSLSGEQRRELAGFEISVNRSAWADDRKELTLSGGNPLGIVDVALDVAGDRELILDWGLDSVMLG